MGEHEDEHSLSVRVYTGSVFTLGYVIPLLVIMCSYVALFCAARNMMASHNSHVTALRELRVAKTVSMVIGLFVLCWSPFFLVNMVWVFCGCGSTLPAWPIHLSKLMHYSNSAMNFFVYAVTSPDFRNYFLKVLCSKYYARKVKRNNVPMLNGRLLSTPHI